MRNKIPNIRMIRYGVSVEASYLHSVMMGCDGVAFISGEELNRSFARLRRNYSVLRSWEREARRRGVKLSPWKSRPYVETIIKRAGTEPAKLRLGGTI